MVHPFCYTTEGLILVPSSKILDSTLRAIAVQCKMAIERIYQNMQSPPPLRKNRETDRPSVHPI